MINLQLLHFDSQSKTLHLDCQSERTHIQLTILHMRSCLAELHNEINKNKYLEDDFKKSLTPLSEYPNNNPIQSNQKGEYDRHKSNLDQINSICCDSLMKLINLKKSDAVNAKFINHLTQYMHNMQTRYKDFDILLSLIDKLSISHNNKNKMDKTDTQNLSLLEMYGQVNKEVALCMTDILTFINYFQHNDNYRISQIKHIINQIHNNYQRDKKVQQTNHVNRTLVFQRFTLYEKLLQLIRQLHQHTKTYQKTSIIVKDILKNIIHDDNDGMMITIAINIRLFTQHDLSILLQAVKKYKHAQRDNKTCQMSTCGHIYKYKQTQRQITVNNLLKATQRQITVNNLLKKTQIRRIYINKQILKHNMCISKLESIKDGLENLNKTPMTSLLTINTNIHQASLMAHDLLNAFNDIIDQTSVHYNNIRQIIAGVRTSLDVQDIIIYVQCYNTHLTYSKKYYIELIQLIQQYKKSNSKCHYAGLIKEHITQNLEFIEEEQLHDNEDYNLLNNI